MSNPSIVGPLFYETVSPLVNGRCFPVHQAAPDFPSVVYGFTGEDTTQTAEGPVRHRMFLWYEVRASMYQECIDIDERILAALIDTGRLGDIRGHTDDWDEDLSVMRKTRTVTLV